MIEVKDITFRYQKRIVLDHVSLRFEPGKCACIDGPNGCGKSTLFRVLNGLSFPESGQYFFNDEEVTEEKMKNEVFAKNLHKKIGYLFQNSEMQLFTRSVEDEIAFGLFQLGYDRKKVHEMTEKYIDLLGLKEVRKQAPFNLSGGEKKRTALAAVLAMEPEVYILDEPMAGLDEDGQEWILSFMQEMRKENKTMIIATHQKELIQSTADVVIHMDRNHHIV